MDCILMADCTSKTCDTQASCSDFNLANGGADNCFISSVISESLDIGGAEINVYRLLGVHEQTSTTNLSIHGSGISGGGFFGSSADNAFETTTSVWKSLQTNFGVLTSAWIGYDFGSIKTSTDVDMYGIETSVRHTISSIRLRQSSQQHRATRIRIERSDDSITWFGVALIDVPDDNQYNLLDFDNNVSARYWRLRPIEFNGTYEWRVDAIELIDHTTTSISNIQDPIFQENRDRDYADNSLMVKGSYDLIDAQTDLSRFGIELPTQALYIQVSFGSMVATIGRPIIIGDILQLPSETQYDSNMNPILKYLEVTDTGWSTSGYMPSWTPTIMKIVASPMMATQETQDIFGGFKTAVDLTGLANMNDGKHPVFQDLSNISTAINNKALDDTPERGMNTISRTFSQEEIDENPNTPLETLNVNQKSLYVEDGIPPNEEPFTEGDTYPPNPNNGDYHRLIYSGLAKDVPIRLFRFSSVKNRWLFMESDKRAMYNQTRPKLAGYLKNGN